MGIKFSSLIEGKPIELEQLAGKRIAIDSFNWLYQFLAIIRGADGNPLMDSRGRVTSHLSGLFYRTINLLEAGVKPIYVFDGKPPEFKHAETERRREVRAVAKEKWHTALERGDLVEAKKQAMRSTTLTNEMIEDAKVLLESMGVPVIQAPSEGEALCASMASVGDAWATASQDFDSLLFGTPRLIRNLSIYGKRKYMKQGWMYVNPEIITLDSVLKELEIDRNMLIILGILVGTDYNPGGIEGIGPVKGLKLVKEKKTLEAVLEKTGWTFSIPAKEIFDFFKNQPKFEYKIEFKTPDNEKITKLLCGEHNFSHERIESALARLDKKHVTKSKSKPDKPSHELSVFFKK